MMLASVKVSLELILVLLCCQGVTILGHFSNVLELSVCEDVAKWVQEMLLLCSV
jgi:hypothetical protein